MDTWAVAFCNGTRAVQLATEAQVHGPTQPQTGRFQASHGLPSWLPALCRDEAALPREPPCRAVNFSPVGLF